MTQAIFLTLQKGERIICWRLRPALLASLAGACLAGLALLAYPDAPLRGHLSELRELLRAQGTLSPSRMAEIEALIASIAHADPLDAEAHYVELFDRGRRTSLHLFEHVYGDSRERGQAMVDLAQTYEKAGLFLAEGELPDYLPAVLEFASTQPLREARDAFEKSYFEFHLAKEGGSMTRVAEKTGLERTHLYRKLKQLGVDLSRNKRGG